MNRLSLRHVPTLSSVSLLPLLIGACGASRSANIAAGSEQDSQSHEAPAAKAHYDKAPLQRLADRLVGTWSHEGEILAQVGWAASGKGRTTYELVLDGRAIREVSRSEADRVYLTHAYWGWDQFHETYRIVGVDDQYGFVDMSEGRFDEQGRFVVTNLDTGIGFPAANGAMTFHRITISFSGDGKEMTNAYDVTIDRGKSWMPWLRGRSKRVE